jgi:Ca2+-transporting ATPase
MTFVVMGLGIVFEAIANRRDPGSGLSPPVLKAVAIAVIPVAFIFLGTELPGLQSGLMTQALSGRQWLACIGLALLVPLVIESAKWFRQLRLLEPGALNAGDAMTDENGGGGAGASPDSVRVLRRDEGSHDEGY